MPAEKMTDKRTDIQVLRAIAVLLVLFYHAGSSLLPRGYLGVDIFFVISGFLITKMIVEGIDHDRFSFAQFYARRAKRLLPAAYCTLAGTTLLATQFLTQNEYRDFLKQLIGAITFTANIVLWTQTGYFDGPAELKPLLHVWSLSLEEQYYLMLPVVLVLVAARMWLIALTMAFVVSLTMYLIFITRSPDATFFLLPTRAWELLLGSLCAIAHRRAVRLHSLTLLLPIALGLLVLVPTIELVALRPGLDAVVVTSATAILILGRYGRLQDHYVSRLMSRIGDWSYSIYLVHWPLFAFASNAYLGQHTPETVRYTLVVISLLLGYLQYRFVETPFRAWNWTTRRTLATALSASAVFVLAVPMYSWVAGSSHADYVVVRRVNYGLSAACEYKDVFEDLRPCKTSDDPQYAVWGDSYAMALVPGLVESKIGQSLVQITKSACSPIQSVALMVPGTMYNEHYAKACIAFNDSVMEYLKHAPEIGFVILSSPFNFYADGVIHVDRERTDPSQSLAILAAFDKTIQELRAAGKKVVIIAPPPAGDFDMGLCLERLDSGLALFGRVDCDFPESTNLAVRGRGITFLKQVETKADVTVLWPSDVLCAKGICRSRFNGKFMYRDAGHLSYQGSIEFASAFQLAERVHTVAR